MAETSIFNIIAPIMIGPSSSHTAGAIRLGLLARTIYNNPIKKVSIKLYNSFAKTGHGHGTDKGILAGILGYGVDDTKVKDIFNTDEAKKLDYNFEFLEDLNRHPNAVDIILEGAKTVKISGASLGAGKVKIDKINNFSISLTGEYNTLILIYKDHPGVISKVTGIIQNEQVNIASLVCDRSAKGEEASMCVCLDDALNYSVIEKIKKIDDLFFIQHISKLES